MLEVSFLLPLDKGNEKWEEKKKSPKHQNLKIFMKQLQYQFIFNGDNLKYSGSLYKGEYILKIKALDIFLLSNVKVHFQF